MAKFLNGETLLWACFALLLLGVIFNPKPLKQIAAESWARSVANLKSSGPFLAGLMGVCVAVYIYFRYIDALNLYHLSRWL
jgi:hypothetical protein